MKKSNKLLLVGFGAVVLLLIAIHVTLYAKYKSGNYTIVNSEEDFTRQSMLMIPNVLVVSVQDVPDATVKFSDAARVEKTEEEDVFRYVQKGDTLLIYGSNSLQQNNVYRRIALQVPYNATLSAVNSSLSFEAGRKAAENNPTIHLDSSNVVFSGSEGAWQLGHLKVVASNHSAVLFDGKTRVAQLEAQLSQSSFEYSGGDLGQLSIITDSASRISLPSKHLLKANIKTIATQ